MLAADVSRINFPALSTISGVEKLASFFLVSFLLFFKRQARIDRVSRVYRQGNSREGSSLWNSSFSAFSGGLGRSFLLCSLAFPSLCTNVTHHRFTDVARRDSAEGHGNAGNLYSSKLVRHVSREGGVICGIRGSRV